MANDLNRCEFIGRLGRDVELKYLPSGKAVANISIAVGKSWKDKESGERQDATTWVPIVAYGRLAEIMSEFLKKGSQIFISGEYAVRKWQDKEGKDRYTTEIVASEMQMLGSRAGGSGEREPAEAGASASTGKPAGGFDDFDDDIPF